jgi:hypothetical protein
MQYMKEKFNRHFEKKIKILETKCAINWIKCFTNILDQVKDKLEYSCNNKEKKCKIWPEYTRLPETYIKRPNLWIIDIEKSVIS